MRRLFDPSAHCELLVEGAARSVKQVWKVADLIDFANRVVEQWAPDVEEWNVDVGVGWMSDVIITVRLKKNQSVSQVRRSLVIAMAKSRRFKPAEFTDLASEGKVTWDFKERDADGVDPHRNIALIVYLGETVVCKQVPTGEMVPKMKTVCVPIEEEEVGEKHAVQG